MNANKYRISISNWRTLSLGIALFWIATSMVACGVTSVEQQPDQVTVQLKWRHQAQFAGFYAAVQQNYYADENIEVKLLPGGPTATLIDSVVEGGADFGVTSADDLLGARTEGIPVKAIATIYRRNPLVYFSLPDSGISRPQDFVNTTIRVGANQQVIFDALMAQVGISPDQYTISRDPGLDAFYTGDIQVSNGYLINEVLAAKSQEIDLNVIFPDDYGIHFYSDTIFATDEFLASSPDLTARFVRATIKGWRWAIENPVEAGKLALIYNSDLEVNLQVGMMEASVPLIHTGEDQLGWMRRDIWLGMQEILLEQGVLESAVDIDQVFTLEFLEQTDGK
ncbi:MAG: ABC transporter substrate-binding protein [Anaerolineales bacterium]|nr:ABC transporter substrate-binding protein [Chloroflexota bacterium]MBL6982877.1 ABC transporter substrate-binding protein [Anaerolineales bacterium]